MYTTAVEPADLGVVECAAALAGRKVSSRELTEACLARIAERDGTHSHDGDPGSINAWVRVYEEDARAAAAAADERIAAGDAPVLCGVPIGLKDLYAVAGKPLTASSRVLDETPDRDCDAWARLRAEGMVLLGHLHVHEFAAAERPTRSGAPGRSSARRAARAAAPARRSPRGRCPRRPAPTPPARCASPRRSAGHRRSSRRAASSRSGASCRSPRLRPSRADDPNGAGLRAAARGAWPASGHRRSAARSAAWALSPRVADLDPDVADGLERALAALPGDAGRAAAPATLGSTSSAEFFDMVLTEMLVWHRRFQDRWGEYRYSNRARLEHAVERAMTAEEYFAGQVRRVEDADAWRDWFAEHRWTRSSSRPSRSSHPCAAAATRSLGRPRRPLADALLGLDGLSGRLAALGRRLPQRPAGQRLADRPAGVGVGPARVGHHATGRAWYGLAVIDLAAVNAIDVHVHTERTRDGHDPMPPELRSAAARVLQKRRAAADRRRRRRVLPRARARRRPLHSRLGVAQRDRADPERGDPRRGRAEPGRDHPVRERRPGAAGRGRARAQPRRRGREGVQVPPEPPGVLPERPRGLPAVRGDRGGGRACALPLGAQRHRHGRPRWRRAAPGVLEPDVPRRRRRRLPRRSRSCSPTRPSRGRTRRSRSACTRRTSGSTCPAGRRSTSRRSSSSTRTPSSGRRCCSAPTSR